jgi:TldD protein
MFNALTAIIAKTDGAYADIRYEVKRETKIVFNTRELAHLDSNVTDGFVVRVLKAGGLSSVAFTKLKSATEALTRAQENAVLMGKSATTPIRLAKTPVVHDRHIPALKGDPRNIPIDEKIALTKKYNDMSLAHSKIVSTTMQYTEVIREKYFVTTEGSQIREDLVTTRIGGFITSTDGTLLQNVRVGVGGSSGFNVLRDRENEFSSRTALALDLLTAQPVAGGVYNVILNQHLAGVFTHEAFGHFSEADLIEDNPSMREAMKRGTKIGTHVLNITDDPTTPGQLGFYKYDDEGVVARPTPLLKNGVVVGRLHSRRTAASFDEPPSGHAVAEDYRYEPIVRMGNIYIEPGSHTLDEMMQMLGDGLYILDARGGQTSGENFTFGAQYGYRVVNGKKAHMVRDINLSGNLYETLNNIRAVGNDLQFSETGSCGKGQINIRSGRGAPHLAVKDVVIGGV